MENIKEKITRFYGLVSNSANGGPNTRYRSWEWCHQAFMNKRIEYQRTDKPEEKDKIIDELALHLAFYLASWGMYRGSSFLLQRDYKAHKVAVGYILENKYDLLWDYQPDYNNVDVAVDLLFSEENKYGIYKRIGDSYNPLEADKDNPTDTLITKILMGTYGCIPAYDRFLKSGIAAYNNCKNNKPDGDIKLTKNITSNSFKTLTQFYLNHKKEFVNPSAQIYYPPMKCVDMFFWEIGYEIEIANGLKDNNNDVEKKSKLFDLAVSLSLCNKNQSFEEAAMEIIKKNQ